jgi:hypothetical protein
MRIMSGPGRTPAQHNGRRSPLTLNVPSVMRRTVAQRYLRLGPHTPEDSQTRQSRAKGRSRVTRQAEKRYCCLKMYSGVPCCTGASRHAVPGDHQSSRQTRAKVSRTPPGHHESIAESKSGCGTTWICSSVSCSMRTVPHQSRRLIQVRVPAGMGNWCAGSGGAQPAPTSTSKDGVEKACFGAGCYWGTEKYFRRSKYPGSESVQGGFVGFMGPATAKKNPTYREVRPPAGLRLMKPMIMVMVVMGRTYTDTTSACPTSISAFSRS